MSVRGTGYRRRVPTITLSFYKDIMFILQLRWFAASDLRRTSGYSLKEHFSFAGG